MKITKITVVPTPPPAMFTLELTRDEFVVIRESVGENATWHFCLNLLADKDTGLSVYEAMQEMNVE